jgi:hypothetical protein
MSTRDILPFSIIITYPGKMPAIISLSGTDICGDEISDVGDRGTPGYRREWQEAIRPKGLIIFGYGRFLAR